MRGMRIVTFGMWLLVFACGRTSDLDETDDPTTGSGATSGTDSDTTSGTDSGATPGVAGSSQLSPSGTSGASSAGGTSGQSGSTSTGIAVPTHSRACILGRARGLEAPPPPIPPIELPNGGAGGADFGVGAGDLSVLVVFDMSGSMGSGWDGRSKWQVANEAFMKAIEGVLDNLTLATIFFPVGQECEVRPLSSEPQIGFTPGRAFAENWLATEASRTPIGGTPLGLAFDMADAAIEEACELGLLEDRFRVVLITDGEPNCDTDLESLTILPSEWRAAGVETRVMGLPGSAAAHTLLDSIALAGGTEQAQILGRPEELDDGLYIAVR